ncbi:TPA: hypothetical protein ACP7Q5_004919 [Escherichia coli]|jgi:multidrug efflux pump subunit AcrA (membrane-fusion protein)|uniref:Uncharacterized protein n=13 Tax=root TaxID=1 RepID=A0A8S5UIU8_9CAUD|nr:hypothetical protein [Enterococcus faecium]ELG7156278.1 hypothetical protein [Staphylococcus aureus]DAF94355.1 MAG TPA: hypothetical protein [Myoviridae sp. ctu2j3]HDW3906810.1 hypothetical protein [Escherichia coli]HEH8886008.1 hypothetical protein [Salmonella enterica]ELL1201155.1 hypothetical protein [Staphylococcus aureus]
MHYKTNRQNHDFQIAFFLVGSCQTADAAYGLLHDLRQDREAALASARASEKRILAKVMRAEAALQNADNEADRLDAEAELDEIAAMREINESNVRAAEDEVAFIHECIKRIEPYRKYKDMDDRQAFEAAQQEEWKLTLMRRAENYLLSQGSIPHDHFETMRLHPEFSTVILPHVNRVHQLSTSKEASDRQALVELLASGPSDVRKVISEVQQLRLESK